MVGGAIPGLFTSTGASLVCRLASTVQGSLVGAAIGGTMGAASGYLDTRTMGGALQGLESGAAWGALGGGLAGFTNPQYCFVAGTQVLVSIEDEGQESQARQFSVWASIATVPRVIFKTIAIEEIVRIGGGERGDGGGQYVLARDQHDLTSPITPCRVLRTFQRMAHRLRLLTLRSCNGSEQIVRTTEEHPFYVAHAGWTRARNLRPGDRVAGLPEQLLVCENTLEAHAAGITVFNLEIEHAHTYFVRSEGCESDVVWVHNAEYDVQGLETELSATRAAQKSGSMSSVALDSTTGEYFRGGSGVGDEPGSMDPMIQSRIDSITAMEDEFGIGLEKQGCGECSDIRAINRAVQGGSDINNLVVANARRVNGVATAPCQYCQIVGEGVTWATPPSGAMDAWGIIANALAKKAAE
jgi:hypothetical protein